MYLLVGFVYSRMGFSGIEETIKRQERGVNDRELIE